jgi:hypothetical protein
MMISGIKNNFKHNSRCMTLLFFILFSIKSFAQLTIKGNTTITINGVLSSKEINNTFDSNLGGTSELVLNGKEQALETASGISLPTLHIANASQLAIKSDLILRGDLIIDSGVLNLTKQVRVGGKIMLKNDATIKNSHLITIPHDLYVFNDGCTSVMSVQWGAYNSILLVESKISLVPNDILGKSLITSYNESIFDQCNGCPFSPPPEYFVIVG